MLSQNPTSNIHIECVFARGKLKIVATKRINSIAHMFDKGHESIAAAVVGFRAAEKKSHHRNNSETCQIKRVKRRIDKQKEKSEACFASVVDSSCTFFTEILGLCFACFSSILNVSHLCFSEFMCIFRWSLATAARHFRRQ